MKGGHIVGLLSEYLDGRLDQAVQRRVQEHLAACAECRAVYEDLEAMRVLVHSLPETAPPEGFRTDLMMRLEQLEQQAGKPGMRTSARTGRSSEGWGRFLHTPARRWAAAAAVFLLLAGGLGFYLDRVVPVGSGVATTLSVTEESGSVPPEVAMDAQDMAGHDGEGSVQEFARSVPEAEPESGTVDRFQAGGEVAEPPMVQDFGSMVIRRGRLDLYVDSVEAAFASVTAKVRDEGGYVESSSFTRESRAFPGFRSQRSVQRPVGLLSLRIPSARFETLIEDLCALGRECDYHTSSEDVGRQYVDTEARLRNLRAQESRLLEILEQAGSVDELLRVEQELWRLREQIEIIDGQLRYWDRAIAMSTLTVNLREERLDVLEIGEVGYGQRLASAFRQSLDSLIRGIELMIIGVGALLPWTVLALIGWYVSRRWRRN